MEISLFQIPRRVTLIKYKSSISLLMVAMAIFPGCSSVSSLNLSQTYNEGYILDQNALDSVSVGSSQEQVLIALGSPSLKIKYDDEVFYYISQTWYRGARFLKAKIVDRKILAVYFDKDKQVVKVANYGLRDGQIFDFITQTTPTPGKDQSFLTQMIKSVVTTTNLPTTNR
ncbi:small protein A, outer membrane lipoprotein [Bartonella australis AUST/NH1]|uniref:Small protein A, outer membrane lipoprotein n=1 Tax=Bartonella australis (strain Aust/NH1) TaxID=1094489 RepID=M1N3J0_BARAA|nr:outer membrane protein assembly factor BamE [Bartonella australis]AGF74469.1 small protein A, outer membrane lipoprotein [Bartonella australis AUST/NH1]